MSKCADCKVRKYFAIAFDLHWHGEEDCPMPECKEEDGEEDA